MSSSGIGRGRGWLNINKNQDTKPGIPIPAENFIEFNTSDIQNIVQNLQNIPTVSSATYIPYIPNPKYAEAITQFFALSVNDDSQQAKTKEFIKKAKQLCSDGDEVKDLTKEIYLNCLENEEHTEKIICLVYNAGEPINFKIHDVKLNFMLTNYIQRDFDNKEILKKFNPKWFRNSVKLLNGLLHSSFAGPLKTVLSHCVITYSDMLLESSSDEDLQVFTTQLYMSGFLVKDCAPSQLSKTLLKVRDILANNNKITLKGKWWLLMAIDLSYNRYKILPTELHKFYLSNIGEDLVEAMLRLKKYNRLTVQTNFSNTLDNIQSNVNVLQVNNCLAACDLNKTPENSTPEVQINTDSSSRMNNIGTWESRTEKTPRPILGAGSRFFLDRFGKPEDLQGNKKETNVKNSGPNKPKQHPKGWEHDDRF